MLLLFCYYVSEKDAGVNPFLLPYNFSLLRLDTKGKYLFIPEEKKNGEKRRKILGEGKKLVEKKCRDLQFQMLVSYAPSRQLDHRESCSLVFHGS